MSFQYQAINGIDKPLVIGRQQTDVSVTGTLSETNLATFTIPAGTLKPNSCVEIRAFWTYSNNANTKTIRYKFGNTYYSNIALTTTSALNNIVIIKNRNSLTSQIGSFGTVTGFGSTAGNFITSNVDTSQAVIIAISGTLANVGDTITLNACDVRVIYD